jgi:hypothetical protein
MSTFEPGSTVYDRDGREAIYYAHVPSAGHVIAYSYDTPDGDVRWMEPEVVREVYDDAMSQRVHPEIAKAEADLAALRAQIATAYEELNRERAARRASLKEIEAYAKDQPALDGLLAYLRGGITHYVIGFGIAPAEKVAGKRLVSLVTAEGGGLAYRISTYHDGSGSSDEGFPARSYEEALRILAEKVDKCESRWPVQRTCETYPDLPVSPETRARVDLWCAEDRETQRQRITGEIEALRAKLEAL